MTGPRYPGFDTLSLHAGAALEARIAMLEGGVAGIATASAQAALHLAIATIAGAGSHIIAARTLGSEAQGLLRTIARFGVDTTFVDARDLDAWRAAIRPQTRMLVGAALGDPGLEVLDIAQVGALARRHDLPLLVDATLATPWLLQPLEHGADLVIHAAGAFLGGRGDASGGLLVDGGTFDWQRAFEASGRFAELCEPAAAFEGIVFSEASTVGAFALRARREGLPGFGAAMRPHDAGVVLQGLETLSLRMERHVANARAIAGFLASHAAVGAVAYPELDGHPDRALAGALLARGCGAVLGLRPHGGAAAAGRFIGALRLFAQEAAVGGARSRAALHPEGRAGDATVRLSVGLENADDLIDDLARALKLAQKGD